jgi:membrane protein DedA with SNARE-associated domain
MPLPFAMHLLAFNIERILDLVSSGGYVLLFSLLFACGLGLPLPEDLPLIAAGALIARGTFTWPPAAICAWMGIMGGDLMLYRFGQRFGRGITRLPLIGRHVTPQRLDKMEAQFNKYGVAVVAIGRLFAGVRGTMVVVAGTMRYPLPRFIVADGLAAVVSGGLFMLLGYYLGNQLNEHTISKFKHVFVAVAVVVALLCIGWFVWKAKRARRAAEQTAVLAQVGLVDVCAQVHDVGASFNAKTAGELVDTGPAIQADPVAGTASPAPKV